MANISAYNKFQNFQSPPKSSFRFLALAAGLLGVGGATTLISKEFKKTTGPLSTLIPTAHCASCKDDKKDAPPGACREQNRTCDASECLRKGDKEEEEIQVANAALEKALRETKSKAVEFTEEALKSYCVAIEATRQFVSKVYCAAEEANLDSPRFESVWCDVVNSMTRRADLARSALEKGQCAWELLRRLGDIIENGKTCPRTNCNPLLVTAEDTLVCAEKELCAKKKEMDELLKESRIAEQYRNVVEEFRRDLKGEADSLVPSEEARVTLTENEANMVLTHAYKKILRCQKELSKKGTGGC